MNPDDKPPIDYIFADEAMRERLGREWGNSVARHMKLEQGFAVVALCDGEPVGLLSVSWHELPAPLPGTLEAFIDIIEVVETYRRQGISRRMIQISSERAREKGAYQIRAWSSDDKTEAIPMWKDLGFAMCPATTYPKGEEIRGYFVSKVL